MHDEKATAHRLAAYSDAVFAVIVTIMVLELKAREEPLFRPSCLYGPRPSAMQ